MKRTWRFDSMDCSRYQKESRCKKEKADFLIMKKGITEGLYQSGV